MQRSFLGGLALSVLTLVACASASTSRPVSTGIRPGSSPIVVSEALAAACRLRLEASFAPPDLERVELLPADRSLLRQLGPCFVDGPMKGARLVMAGGAAPTGAVDRARAQAIRRAGNAAAYLEQLGLDASRIEMAEGDGASRGGAEIALGHESVELRAGR